MRRPVRLRQHQTRSDAGISPGRRAGPRECSWRQHHPVPPQSLAPSVGTATKSRKNKSTMKRIAIVALWLSLCCVAADKPTFPELPDSPAKLIGTLKGSGERYTVHTLRLDFVKGSDIPYLVSLLDSKEPCAFVDLSANSQRLDGGIRVHGGGGHWLTHCKRLRKRRPCTLPRRRFPAWHAPSRLAIL